MRRRLENCRFLHGSVYFGVGSGYRRGYSARAGPHGPVDRYPSDDEDLGEMWPPLSDEEKRQVFDERAPPMVRLLRREFAALAAEVSARE
jgi:hypothetical protein